MRKLMFFCMLLLGFACQRHEGGSNAFAPLPDSTNVAINHQIDFLTECITNDPVQPEYYYQRARLYYQIDRLRTALGDINVAIRLKGKDAQYLYWKALILKDLKEYPDALQVAQEALAQGQPNASLYALLGQLFYFSKNSTEALYYLEQSTVLLPSQADAIFYRGVIMYERQDTAAAVREFQRTISFNPSYIEAYARLAEMSLQYQQPQRAASFIGQALAKGVKNETLYLYLAQSLQQQQQADSAMHWYNAALKLRPALWEASHELAKYHVAKRNYILAENYFKQALAFKPNIPNGYFQLGFIYEYYLDRLDDALDAYQKALLQDPENTQVAYSVSRVDRKINNPLPAYKPVPVDTVPKPRPAAALPVSPIPIKRF